MPTETLSAATATPAESQLAAARERFAEVKAREAEVATAHAEEAAALGRGHEVLESWQAEISRLEAADAEETTRQASRMADHVRAGHTSPLPQSAPSAERVAQMLLARDAFSAAAKMVEGLEADEGLARQKLAAAKRATQAAEMALRDAERETLAERCEFHESELRRIGAMLRIYDGGLDTPLSHLPRIDDTPSGPSARVARVLLALDQLSEISVMDTPLNAAPTFVAQRGVSAEPREATA